MLAHSQRWKISTCKETTTITHQKKKHCLFAAQEPLGGCFPTIKINKNQRNRSAAKKYPRTKKKRQKIGEIARRQRAVPKGKLSRGVGRSRTIQWSVNSKQFAAKVASAFLLRTAFLQWYKSRRQTKTQKRQRWKKGSGEKKRKQKESERGIKEKPWHAQLGWYFNVAC